jgi:hypothetical protein
MVFAVMSDRVVVFQYFYFCQIMDIHIHGTWINVMNDTGKLSQAHAMICSFRLETQLKLVQTAGLKVASAHAAVICRPSQFLCQPSHFAGGRRMAVQNVSPESSRVSVMSIPPAPVHAPAPICRC